MRTLRKVGSEKAITLIALVVTIVILLILAGVTITMTLGENGLFTKAREGKEVYDEASVKENLSMLITQYTWDKVAGKTDKSLGDYLKENGATSVKENADGKTLEVKYKGYAFTINKENGEITDTDKIEANDYLIGAIVKYTPDVPSTNYDLSSNKSGYETSQTIDSAYDPTTWKVMEIDGNGNITKLFGVPNGKQKSIYLDGALGYNNGVYLLDDICAKRYGNANLGAGARNLKIEDIESRMSNEGINARNDYKAGTMQYGMTKKYTGSFTQYPNIYTQEKYSGVGVNDVEDGSQVIVGKIDEISKLRMNLNGKSQSESVYTEFSTITTGNPVDNLTCTQTVYQFNNIPSSYFRSTNFYNMMFNTGTYFWVASRCVNCSSNYNTAYFALRCVCATGLNMYGLFYSDGTELNFHYRIAPVVTFDSAIHIKGGSGTTEAPYIIGK